MFKIRLTDFRCFSDAPPVELRPITFLVGENSAGKTTFMAAKLHKLDDAKVKAISDGIKAKCASNDPHVVAVAIISGCRLIFSGDKDLHKDAHNPDILNPKASIYQTKDHRHLLKVCRCPQ